MSDFELYLSERNESVRLRVILEKAERKCAELAAALEKAYAKMDEDTFGPCECASLAFKCGSCLARECRTPHIIDPAAILREHDAEVERRVLERVAKCIPARRQELVEFHQGYNRARFDFAQAIEREFAPKGESDDKPTKV